MPEEKHHCFVIGPIGDEDSPQRLHADWRFQEVIIRVFENDFSDWAVERADQIPTSGMVTSQIINRLHVAELVIADLSFHNANAFYEMSIRHNVGKPIVHMILKDQNIPFDVTLHRAIKFSRDHPNDLKKAREELHAAVSEAIQSGFKPDNPITHARGWLKLEEHAAPEMKVLSDEIQAIRARLESVEASLARERVSGATNLVTSTVMSPSSGALRIMNPRVVLSPKKSPSVAHEPTSPSEG